MNDLPGENLDDFGRGAEHLQKTRLAAWVKATTASCLAHSSTPISQSDNENCEGEDKDKELEEGSRIVMRPTLGMMCVNEGQLLIEGNFDNFDLDDNGLDADSDLTGSVIDVSASMCMSNQSAGTLSENFVPMY